MISGIGLIERDAERGNEGRDEDAADEDAGEDAAEAGGEASPRVARARSMACSFGAVMMPRQE
jgi:hypothetical protein